MSIDNLSNDLGAKLFEDRKAETAENFQKVVDKKSQQKNAPKENVIDTNDIYVPSKKEAPVEKVEKDVKEDLKSKPSSEVFTGGSKEANNGVDSFKASAAAFAPAKPAEPQKDQEEEVINPQVESSLGNLQALLSNYAQPEAPASPQAQ